MMDNEDLPKHSKFMFTVKNLQQKGLYSHSKNARLQLLNEIVLQEREERIAGEERETEKNPSASLNSKRKARNIPRS